MRARKIVLMFAVIAVLLIIILGRSITTDWHNTFDQARIGTLGIKPQYVTEVFVDKENADMALHILHTLS